MRDYLGTGMGKHLVYRLFNAKKYAYICSPYIDYKYSGAILKMADRGIPIKLVTTDRQPSGFYASEYFGKYYRDSKNKDLEVLLIGGEGFVHSKLYVIDDSYAVDGSANLTYAGLWNQVNNIHVYDTSEEVQNLKSSFEKIWDYNSLRTINQESRPRSNYSNRRNTYQYRKGRQTYFH